MQLLTSCAFVALAAVAASAPTESDARTNQQQKQDFFRDKRSQYGVQYVSPCAAAAAAAAAAPLPPFGPPYHYDVPMHGGYVVPHYGYGGPHYRSVEPIEEQELLGFSDVNHIMQEHMPMARYGAYGTVPAHMPIPAPSHAAYGVFPNANSGGCNVPLLFSCSPSIVQGRIVQAQPHQHVSSPFDTPAEMYRVVMDPHTGVHEEGQEEAPHDRSQSH